MNLVDLPIPFQMEVDQQNVIAEMDDEEPKGGAP